MNNLSLRLRALVLIDSSLSTAVEDNALIISATIYSTTAMGFMLGPKSLSMNHQSITL